MIFMALKTNNNYFVAMKKKVVLFLFSIIISPTYSNWAEASLDKKFETEIDTNTQEANILNSENQNEGDEKGEKNNLICSVNMFKKYKSTITSLPGSKDKLKHCIISCLVSRKCNSLEVVIAGYIKEIFDIFGQGKPEAEDLSANMRGIEFSKSAKSEEDCSLFCNQVY